MEYELQTIQIMLQMGKLQTKFQYEQLRVFEKYVGQFF